MTDQMPGKGPGHYRTDKLTILVRKSSHGWSEGTTVYYGASGWATTDGNETHLDLLGIVIRVISSSLAEVQVGGQYTETGAPKYSDGAGGLAETGSVLYLTRFGLMANGPRSLRYLVDVDDTDIADGYILQWDEGTGKHVYVDPETATLGNRTAYSVLGNPSTPDAPVSDITADVDTVLARATGGDVEFQQVATAMIADDAVTEDKLADTAVTPGSYGAGFAVATFTVDQQGRLTAAATSSIVTGGDLDGQVDDVTVEAIQGHPVSATSPIAGDILVSNGTQYTPGQIISTRGSLLTRDASAIVQLAIGAARTILSSDGTDPSWIDAAFPKIGNYATKTTYTSGSGTHSFTANRNYFIAIITGGGGGGGAGSGTAGGSDVYAGGGGGGGETVVMWGKIDAASLSYSVGAGGAAGTSGGAGTNGSDTTLGGATAKGGSGGDGGGTFGGRGSGGVATSQPDFCAQSSAFLAIPIPGQPGGSGRVAGITWNTGTGAVTSYQTAGGAGGRGLGGAGYGGSGATPGVSAAGSGTAGRVTIYEIA